MRQLLACPGGAICRDICLRPASEAGFRRLTQTKEYCSKLTQAPTTDQWVRCHITATNTPFLEEPFVASLLSHPGPPNRFF